MRFLKLLILGLLCVVAVFLAAANRGWVTLRLAPEGFPLPFPASIELPLFIVLLAAVLFGVVIGLFLELARERRHRKAERMYHHEARTLKREVKRLAQKAGEEDDDILGLKSP